MAAAAVVLAVASFAPAARATGFTDVGDDFHPREHAEVELHGGFRTRNEALYNLDLDRGPTPSGDPLFPVAAGDPTGQTLVYGDMRLRTDLAVYAPGSAVAVKARIDVLDDVAFGGNPQGIPSASRTQSSPSDAMHVKRVYGEVLTPIGLLAAGRMGSHWGLGMLANGGDCADCDSGDAADRIALVTPLAGHLFALAYDATAIGPTAYRADGIRKLGLAPSTAAHTVTFAFLRWHDDLAIRRRRAADLVTLDYGAYASHRWQNADAPVEYLPLASPSVGTSAQIMTRGYRATALDGWVRVIGAKFRVEMELAYVLATVDQPSLVPGVLYRTPVTSHQLGAALESELGAPLDPFGGGLDAGYASGDPAPGMGAIDDPARPLPKAGDLNGAQANPPFDAKVDNFRFHPDYRVDRILFREIVGTVTDAFYLRPHARWHVWQASTGTLTASIAGIASWAVYASSTPGQKSPLGVEIDPTLAWTSRDGFAVALEQATLFPLAGLDNPQLGLRAKPAQLWRLRLTYAF